MAYEKAALEQTVLDIAERQLFRYGYRNLNLNEVAREAGISKVTLYKLFQGKYEVAERAVERLLAEADREMAGLLRAELPLREKQRTKIAEAKFNPRNCLDFQAEEECGRCASACPVRAITLRGNGTPRPVNTELCIGCGACQEVCPAPEKAMTVHEIERQLTLPEPVRQ